ncbi:LysR family transcriptional regulator [Sphingobium sp. KCTC 72723]|uniref:LysR family transcriptional regulator n=1 Tax=Sphingobium sp. KCTC 72723 TaxID=2733867 RepID=UPI00165DAF17|nr:LysR family transcriptional regulator [Sphingobium sp. KCTC 72723]
MDTPSLRQLDIFAQMVAAGSITRCASDMGVSVDQIARDMASLEMRLGYRLFDDLTGAARLTPAGRKTAQAMTLLSQDAPEDWDAVQVDPPTLPVPVPAPASPRQTITLAAPAQVFGQVQDALSTFEAANDDIAIALDLHVLSSADAARALQSGRADIAYFYALEEPADLPSRYGWSEPVSLYAGTNHPLARADVVSRADIAITPALALDRSNAMRAIIEAALVRGRADTGPVALESDNMFAILAALREGAGIFAAFGPLARDLGRMDGIRRLALDMPLPAVEIRQALGPRAAETPAVEALAKFLFL